MTERADQIVRFLFAQLMADFERMPSAHAQHARNAEQQGGLSGAARVIADYVAGMTDRFAIDAYTRLGGQD